jgi:hypothetical protein
VETKREEDVVTPQSLIPSVEIALCHGESVAEVQIAVHVRKGKCLKIFRPAFAGLHREVFQPIPDMLSPALVGNQLVPS